MSFLKIKLRVSPITQLAKDSDGRYSFIVDLTKANGSPIDSIYLPNQSSITTSEIIENGVSKIPLVIDIASENYSVVTTIKIYDKSHSKLLVEVKNYSLINRIDSGTAGEYKYALMTKGLDDHLKLTKRTEGDIDYISDVSNVSLDDAYEYRYMVNAEVITGKSKLKDYPVPRINGLRVWKMKTKVGLDSVNRWEDADGGYYDRDAGQSFSYNVTASFETGVYIATSEDNEFESHVSTKYDPSLQMPQWADISRDIKLSKDRVFFLNRGDWPMDLVMRKGVTHISHYHIPRPNGDETLAMQMKRDGDTYSDVQTMPQIFNLPDSGVDEWVDGYNKRYWPHGGLTDEEVKQQLSRYSLTDRLWIGETMENRWFIGSDKSFWNPFYAGIRKLQNELFDSKGMKSYLCHNYFMFWPAPYHINQSSPESIKKLFRTPIDQLPRTNFSPGGSLSTTNLIVEAVYLAAPDIQQFTIYDSILKLNIIRYMGYESGIFATARHEWRGNNFFETKYDDGKYYEKGKIPVDPNVLFAYSYLSQVYGKVFVEWGGIGKSDEGRTYNKRTFEPTLWYRNGATSPDVSYENPDKNDMFPYISSPNFPHAVDNGVGYYGYDAGTDISQFGLDLWDSTWGSLEGGKELYLKFRIDGGSWVSPVNEWIDDVINANTNKRAFVNSKNKDGKICWFYLNPYADNKWHTLEVELPNGTVVSHKVAGNGMHIKMQSL